jgi:hypothetical protein
MAKSITVSVMALTCKNTALAMVLVLHGQHWLVAAAGSGSSNSCKGVKYETDTISGICKALLAIIDSRPG